MTDQNETVEYNLIGWEPEIEENDIKSESKRSLKALNDPLKAHLRALKHYPLLTEEEKKAAFRKYRESGDQEIRDLLVVSNLRLVVKIAFSYDKKGRFPMSDLIQEGNIGLIKAVERFDPDREVKFSYYSSFWIKAYIMKYMSDNWKLIRLINTRNRRKLFSQLNREKERLSKLGIDPSTEELAKNLQVKARDVFDMEMILNSREISLDEPVHTNEESGPHRELVPSNVDIEKIVFDYEIRNKAQAIFGRFRKTLSAREVVIFDNRICCEEALTLKSVGDMLGLSRERIRQMEKAIYEKLYNFKEVEEIMTADALKGSAQVIPSQARFVSKENSKPRRRTATIRLNLNYRKSGPKDRDPARKKEIRTEMVSEQETDNEPVEICSDRPVHLLV